MTCSIRLCSLATLHQHSETGDVKWDGAALLVAPSSAVRYTLWLLRVNLDCYPWNSLSNFWHKLPRSVLGGTAGGVVGYCLCESFRPLPDILTELTPAQKQELYEAIMAALVNLNYTDGFQLIVLVMASPALKQTVISVLINYFKNELGAQTNIK